MVAGACEGNKLCYLCQI